MQSIKSGSLILLTALLSFSGSAQAFSFDFGDDDDDWYRYYSYWGNPNQPWVAPNGMLFYPRLPYFERHQMIDQRQSQMGQKYDAMDELGSMLYGRGGFDRATALKLARIIESLAGSRLSQNFHPGSVATDRSRTMLSLWNNRTQFNANADALRLAAKALADEIAKQPANGDESVMLPQAIDNYGTPGKEKIAVSTGVWEKFNALSDVCDSCHRDFRGFRWR